MIHRAGLGLLLVAPAIPAAISAHHSVAASFDVANVVEIEGTLAEVRWQNPHVTLAVAVREGNGEEATWEIETNSVSILRRMDLSRDVLRVGERVRVAGNPARRQAHALFARNLLLPGTREVLLSPESKPRWANETIGASDAWFARAGDPTDPASGIFRVWSTSLGSGNNLWGSRTYPLTDAARAAVEAFDPVDDSPILNCAPKGMPSIMSQPYPIEFVQEDDGTIALRIEEYDIVRTIHMDAGRGRAAPPASDLGHSLGRWEGSTLVVTTTALSWGYFNTTLGIPQSDASEIVERFTPSVDGSRLDYTITVTDPANFTERVVLDKYWLYLPGVQVERYDCIAAA